MFKLTPNADRTFWQETLAYSFTGVDGDGADPSAAVTIDAHGAIYGTTEFGGFSNPNDVGTIFVLRPSEEAPHKFRGRTDGAGPMPRCSRTPPERFLEPRNSAAHAMPEPYFASRRNAEE